jgi:hypothetical protein
MSHHVATVPSTQDSVQVESTWILGSVRGVGNGKLRFAIFNSSRKSKQGMKSD